MTRPANNDLMKLLGAKEEPFHVTPVPVATVHEVLVDEEFISVRQFEEIVDALENAGPDDAVKIALTTPGGSLAAILPMLNAMNNTAAHVHVDVISDVASAGTFLLMLADSVHINPYSTIMFHNVSYGVAGHAGNVQATVKHYEKMNDSLLSEMYKDFLTEAELKHLKDGLEIYLSPEQCYERLTKRNELRMKQIEQATQEAVSLIQRADKGESPVPPIARKPRRKKAVTETE